MAARGVKWRALILGLLAGLVAGGLIVALLEPLFRREPDAETIATVSLRTVQRQAKLTILAARFTAVITSEQQRLAGLLSAKKTLIVPGTVRYEVDWAKITPQSLVWDAAAKTLTVSVPAPQVAGPEIDLAAMREYKDGAILFALTDAERSLDAANRAQVAAALLADARAPALLDLARDAARQAVERTFLLPLAASGVEGAKVVARVG